MLLIALPNEILASIILETRPMGFESFALSCRHLYHLAESQISDHNWMKSRYSSYDAHGKNHPIDLLNDVWRIPIVARYVKSVRLGQHADKEITKEKSKTCNGGIDLLQSLPYLSTPSPSDRWPLLENMRKEFDLDPKPWQSAMLSGSIGPVIPLLICLLRNLETLTLIDTWVYRYIYLLPILDAIAGDSLRQPHLGPHPLSKLRVLYLHHSDDEVGTPLQTFAPFLLLPRLKKVVGYQLYSIGSYSHSWPYGDDVVSNVEEVEMSDSAGGSTDLKEFLRPMKGLRCLKWSHRGFGGGAGYEWNAAGFLQAAANTAGSNLKELSLTTRSSFHSMSSLGDFKPFSQLEYLELSLSLLLGEPAALDMADEQIFNRRSRWHGAPNLAELMQATPHDVDLVKMLPRSIKRLRLLWDDVDVPQLDSIFSSITDSNGIKLLPLLEKVTHLRRRKNVPKTVWRTIQKAKIDQELIICRLIPEHNWYGTY